MGRDKVDEEDVVEVKEEDRELGGDTDVGTEG